MTTTRRSGGELVHFSRYDERRVVAALPLQYLSCGNFDAQAESGRRRPGGTLPDALDSRLAAWHGRCQGSIPLSSTNRFPTTRPDAPLLGGLVRALRSFSTALRGLGSRRRHQVCAGIRVGDHRVGLLLHVSGHAFIVGDWCGAGRVMFEQPPAATSDDRNLTAGGATAFPERFTAETTWKHDEQQRSPRP
jgi:hypothetical protein